LNAQPKQSIAFKTGFPSATTLPLDNFCPWIESFLGNVSNRAADKE
jgi:hypothetical protein